MVKFHARPSLHYRYEHYDPRWGEIRVPPVPSCAAAAAGRIRSRPLDGRIRHPLNH